VKLFRFHFMYRDENNSLEEYTELRQCKSMAEAKRVGKSHSQSTGHRFVQCYEPTGVFLKEQGTPGTEHLRLIV
jgi:hypothetical protein